MLEHCFGLCVGIRFLSVSRSNDAFARDGNHGKIVVGTICKVADCVGPIRFKGVGHIGRSADDPIGLYVCHCLCVPFAFVVSVDMLGNSFQNDLFHKWIYVSVNYILFFFLN